MATDDYDPSKTALRDLFRHILEKGFQMGGVLGLGVVVPIVAYRSRKAHGALINSELTPAVLAALAKSGIGFTTLAGALGAARVFGAGIPEEGIEDRAYRLHFNQGQNRTDKFSRIGAAFGAAAAAFLASPTPTNILGGAVAGAGVGVLAHVATYQSDKSGHNMMIEELKIETIKLPSADK
eukprot:jgi/Botrbrau1/2896/Bobra.0036s0038.1